MNLLIAILICLGLQATPDLLRDPDYVRDNQATVDLANDIIHNHWYEEREGGVVIDPAVSP